jgi:hypothetical protein
MAFLLAGDKSLLIALGAGAIALTVVGVSGSFALSKLSNSPAAAPEAVQARQETARMAISVAERTAQNIASAPAAALARARENQEARQEARGERQQARREAVKSAGASVFHGITALKGGGPISGIKAFGRLGQ